LDKRWHEHCAYDRKRASSVRLFMDYALPRAGDLPLY